jgi:flagellar basal-body rod protein FlgB
MLEKIEILRLSAALAEHASARQAAIAGNIANADTPGYRARDVAGFEEYFQAGDAGAMQQTRPGHMAMDDHPGAPQVLERPDQKNLSPNGNGVSLENEIVAAAGVRRDHDLAIAVYGKSLDILRASLGRR